MRKELVLGCGSRIKKDLYLQYFQEFENPVTLDINPDHKPDIVHDLRVHPLPFFDNEFDEIHVYDVLEHLAYQGDYEFFFKEFNEYWRILKRGGHIFGSVPQIGTKWAMGDPSHKRVIQAENLAFLSQDFYKQVGTTKCSDFRYIYKANFKIVYQEYKNETLLFIMEAIKNESIDTVTVVQDNGHTRSSGSSLITG
jgi:predicted SAM-dependent methyltransferase